MAKVRLKDLSDHDRKEVALFKKFLKRAGAVDQVQAYSDIYGEVVFDAATRAKKGRK